jgi:hypothetical protein
VVFESASADSQVFRLAWGFEPQAAQISPVIRGIIGGFGTYNEKVEE